MEERIISREQFEDFWPLTDVKVGALLQKSGARMVGRISAQEGEFVFKIADPSKTEESIMNDTRVFDFLKKKKFPHIPGLVKTKDRRNYCVLEGKLVYVMERVEGKPPERTVENWGRLGKIMATLHDIPEYPYRTLFTVQSEMPKFQETAGKVPFGKEYMEIVDQLPTFDGLSQSLIHTDIGPHNAIQRPDGLMILVDWDDAGIGTTILDLGFPLICHFVTEDLVFEKEKAKAFYDAYFAKRTLPERERSLIFDAGLFYALMYVPYGEIQKNWKRVKFALGNKDLISSVL